MLLIFCSLIRLPTMDHNQTGSSGAGGRVSTPTSSATQSGGSMQHVESVLRQLDDERTILEDMCADREVQLDSHLQFRAFEKDVVEVWFYVVFPTRFYSYRK